MGVWSVIFLLINRQSLYGACKNLGFRECEKEVEFHLLYVHYLKFYLVCKEVAVQILI